MSTNHTPLPWRIVPIGGERYIESDAGFVCDMQRNDRPDAASCHMADEDSAFIVRACNSHEALINALELVVKLIDEDVIRVRESERNQLIECLEKANVAIALAKS